MDMRGRGQTVVTAEPWGYDADTVADIQELLDFFETVAEIGKAYQ
jgi:hypothetical protein